MRDLNHELYDLKARFYDPVIGRFLSVDPLSADEKQVWFSPYQFGWNNPIRFNDPSGECPECEVERPNPFKGEVYRSTGGADYVFGKGAWTRQGGTLNEVTVSSPNPIQDAVYRGRREFVSTALAITKDATGKVGVGATAAGLVAAPFAPPVGAGLLAVGELFSVVSGVSSATLNLNQGNKGAALTDAVLIGAGTQGNRVLENLLDNGVIGLTDEIILRAIQNTSIEMTGQLVVPAIQKKKDK